jgi:NitT/TauT family transport system substrate-binding protein
MRSSGKLTVLILLFLAVVLLVACGQQETGPPPDEVTMQLKWVHQAQFAGFYVAQDQGYYSEENLKVTFVEGGPGIDHIKSVTSGQSDFGVAVPDRILAARSQGMPVAAIATIFRRSPLVFVSLADSGIDSPDDFLGRVAAVEGGDGVLPLEAMLSNLDLDFHQIEIVPYDYSYASLYAGDADITSSYSTAGLLRIRRAGYEVNLIWPGDYGVHLYSDTLITSDQMIAKNPDLVTRFLRATLRGWHEAIEEPETAVEITLSYAKDTDLELQTEMMEAQILLIQTGEYQIGWMRAEVWQGMHDILLEQGVLDEPVDLDAVYTMEFLHAIYGEEP